MRHEVCSHAPLARSKEAQKRLCSFRPRYAFPSPWLWLSRAWLVRRAYAIERT